MSRTKQTQPRSQWDGYACSVSMLVSNLTYFFSCLRQVVTQCLTLHSAKRGQQLPAGLSGLHARPRPSSQHAERWAIPGQELVVVAWTEDSCCCRRTWRNPSRASCIPLCGLSCCLVVDKRPITNCKINTLYLFQCIYLTNNFLPCRMPLTYKRSAWCFSSQQDEAQV